MHWPVHPPALGRRKPPALAFGRDLRGGQMHSSATERTAQPDHDPKAGLGTDQPRTYQDQSEKEKKKAARDDLYLKKLLTQLCV
jgi:hypothetical protein